MLTVVSRGRTGSIEIWPIELDLRFLAAGPATSVMVVAPGERFVTRSRISSMRGRGTGSGEMDVPRDDAGGDRVESLPRSNEVDVEAMGLVYGSEAVLRSKRASE